MPGAHTPVEQQFRAQLRGTEEAVAAAQRSQQQVFTDPTRGSGDPAHGYAVVVLGSLKAICGINAFGLAVYSGGAWHQVLS